MQKQHVQFSTFDVQQPLENARACARCSRARDGRHWPPTGSVAPALSSTDGLGTPNTKTRDFCTDTVAAKSRAPYLKPSFRHPILSITLTPDEPFAHRLVPS